MSESDYLFMQSYEIQNTEIQKEKEKETKEFVDMYKI